MLELEIMCGYSQAARLLSVKVDAPDSPSSWDGFFTGEGGEGG